MMNSLLAWFVHLRFLQLTLFFLIVLLTIPFRTYNPLVNIAAQLLMLNVIVVTLSASGSRRVLRWLLVGLWLAGLVLYLRVVLFLGPGNHPWDVAATVIVFLLVMVVSLAAILPYIIETRRVTLDTIFAAVVAYLFISSIFANGFTLIYFVAPHSFNLPPITGADQFYPVYAEMIYFSLITIVGVGYGDIVPLLPFPRMLAALEGMLGHFYVAAFVAWLVGTFIAQSIQASQQMARTKPAEPMES